MSRTPPGADAVAPDRRKARSEFGPVAREQLPWLYSLARRLVGADDAEDVVQDCLIKAHRGFGRLRDVQAAPAWFRQILLNCVRDRYRRQSGLPAEQPVADVAEVGDAGDGDTAAPSLYRTIADADPWPYSDSVHLDFLKSLDTADVWRVLDRIDARYRVPLVLTHMEGMPTKQVARMFGVPQNTVLSWLHRGRKHFERELWAYAVDEGLLAESKGARG